MSIFCIYGKNRRKQRSKKERKSNSAGRVPVLNFSFDTIKNFDNHINTSIPCYGEICRSVQGLSKYFVSEGSYIYDIGCSKGTVLKSIDVTGFKNVHKVGIDCSLNLLPSNEDGVAFLNYDLNNDFQFSNASLILSLFTFQFLPPPRRQTLMNNIYEGLQKGGGFIFCEKIYSSHSRLQDMFTFNYYDFKQETFTPEEILDKERNLRKIMHPYTHDENVSMLKEAGFTVFDTFVKSYNFEGIIAIK